MMRSAGLIAKGKEREGWGMHKLKKISEDQHLRDGSSRTLKTFNWILFVSPTPPPPGLFHWQSHGLKISQGLWFLAPDLVHTISETLQRKQRTNPWNTALKREGPDIWKIHEATFVPLLFWEEFSLHILQKLCSESQLRPQYLSSLWDSPCSPSFLKACFPFAFLPIQTSPAL